jgi:hypothetical protein
MEKKYERLQKNPKTNPFVDPAGYRAYVEDRFQAFREVVRKQGGKSDTLVSIPVSDDG